MMISSDQALELVLENLMTLGTESIPLQASLGRVLAEDINASRDFPPFNRVAMDGIAIKYNASNEVNTYICKGLQSAGMAPLTLGDESNCLEVMTGAMLPFGTDTVIPYEHTSQQEGKFIVNLPIKAGSNIHRKGKDLSKGDTLIPKGQFIRTQEIAILATEGKVKVRVLANPKIVIISTGDELVELEMNPEPYQIRASNKYMLLSALSKLNIDADSIHIDDDKDKLEETISKILNEYDVILMSGGVSKGKLDFIPDVLSELGVTKVFHRIAQRPGKPFWFGQKAHNTFVFAFPGNPSSTLVCFKKYFEPWLMTTQGQKQALIKVKLSQEFEFKPNLTYFAQAIIEHSEGQSFAQILTGNGSGDLANLTRIDGFVELPQGSDLYNEKTLYNFIKI